jgi:indolepyruvate ferredoxin oxidoreductase, beta subunit
MSEPITNILLVGVGGQGILLASEILSEVAMIAGLDVKKSEIHGMSQRGGTVNSHIRFGPRVHSPIIPSGEAAFVLALEKLEGLRARPQLARGGRLLVNDFRLEPTTVTTGKLTYPEDAIEQLRSEFNGQFVALDGPALSVKAGDLRTMNTVMLGALSTFLDFTAEQWEQAMQRHIKPKLLEINRSAFEMGRAGTAT